VTAQLEVIQTHSVLCDSSTVTAQLEVIQTQQGYPVSLLFCRVHISAEPVQSIHSRTSILPPVCLLVRLSVYVYMYLCMYVCTLLECVETASGSCPVALLTHIETGSGSCLMALLTCVIMFLPFGSVKVYRNSFRIILPCDDVEASGGVS